ncbi:hypothetical protein PYCC9005_001132 [Savitreella phatthalungensis]
MTSSAAGLLVLFFIDCAHAVFLSDVGTWGLERISLAPWHTGVSRWSTRDRSPSSADFVYNYDSRMEGARTRTYIISAGVDCHHRAIEHNAQCRLLADFRRHREEPDERATSMRMGTAIASIVAGSIVGVARESRVFSARVDRGATVSSIIDALGWVENHVYFAHWPASLLLGYQIPNNLALTRGLERLYHRDVFITGYAVIGSINTCDEALIHNMDEVMTVSGTDADDRYMPSPLSPRGGCIDILAPSVEVPVAYYDPEAVDLLVSSTHPAIGAAFVSGVTNTWRSLPRFRHFPPTQIKRMLHGSAWHNSISGVPQEVPNLLLRSFLPPSMTRDVPNDPGDVEDGPEIGLGHDGGLAQDQ